MQAHPPILHVARLSNWHIGGPYESVPALIRNQHRLGLNVALLASNSAIQALERETFPMFSIEALEHSDLTVLPEPFNCPHLVHFHGYYLWQYARLAAQLRDHSIPYLITPRGAMTRAARSRKRIKKLIGDLVFQNSITSHATAIHCLTLGEASNIGEVACPIYVVPNGVEVDEHFAAEPTDIRPSGKLHVLFLGRLAFKIKGLDLLVSAAARAKQHGVCFHLKLVGPDHAGGRAFLERMIRDLNVMDCVEVCEPVVGEEKHQAFAWADVFVHTSRHEGLPMAVLEALAHGVPCLLTPGTNMADVVDTAGAGWGVPASAPSIAQAFCRIVSERAQLPSMGKAARQLAQTKYSWRKVVEDMSEVYSHIIDTSTRVTDGAPQ